jgi:N-acetylmuramic acid 6-phosphate (MurNAc-6-P) etherase
MATSAGEVLVLGVFAGNEGSRHRRRHSTQQEEGAEPQIVAGEERSESTKTPGYSVVQGISASGKGPFGLGAE